MVPMKKLRAFSWCNNSNKKTSTFLILFVLLNQYVYSQAFDLGSWNIVNIKYKHNEKWSAFAEGQLRSLKYYDHFHYYEYKAGLNYQLHKSLVLTLAAGSYQTYREGGNFELPKNNNEFRLWPQITLSQQINKIKIEQRYRTELRFTSNGYRNRFRYRLGIAYPFGELKDGYKPYQISLSNELFFTDKEPYFERNRIQASFNYKLNKQISIMLGYLHQFDYKINDETGRDFFMIGYYYEVFRNKKI